jgi:uncharacterized protein (DUF2062 family)
MKYLYQIVKNHVYVNLIKPLLASVSPIHETALGSAIGLFVGLTPTVGIQMWIVLIIWLGSKYFLKLKFDLIVGTAIVWISNPFTIFFMYYGFLATGSTFLSLTGFGTESPYLSYKTFYTQLSHILDSNHYSNFEIIFNGSKFLLVDLGYPMLIGSLFYAIPCSILCYLMIKRYLIGYRMRKAKKMGIDYEQWQKLFERK